MKKAFYTCLILLCALEGLMAKATFTGTVIDQQTEEPLVGATVFIKPIGIGLATNALGQFSFKLDEGSYEFEISYIGYNKQTTVVNTANNSEFTFQLSPSNNISEEVIVQSTRVDDKVTSAETINKEDLAKVNLGQDLPVLLNQASSLVFTSDAGNGIGYTSLRIRGMDQTRVNVTVNGIPMNDQESQGVFFVNMPDLSSSTQSIQVQRGVGTSTNGGQAFGSSLNIETEHIAEKPYTQLSSSYGSFNSYKFAMEASTGKLKNNWVFTTRLSKLYSDGYIDRAYSDLKSFYFSGGRFTDKSIFKITAFSGSEKTYQAWYGVTKSEMEENRTYNPYSYENQTDNYQQDNYQMHYSTKLSNRLNLNTALHYTKGRGYYEEYKDDQELSNYLIDPVIIGGETIEESNLIRQRWLDNDFYGFVGSAIYNLKKEENKKWDITVGGNVNNYDGSHFGEVIWAQYASNSNINHEYYRNSANKVNYNTYIKSNTQFSKKLSASAELQSRWVDYSFEGIDDDLSAIRHQVNYHFLNPKVSLSYQLNKVNNIYAYIGTAGKEPLRNDFVEVEPKNWPKPERVIDYELGYNRTSKNYILSANLYYMDFSNQLVLNGAINDVGAYLRTNVEKSHRAGIELETTVQINKWLIFNANGTFSDNRINKHKIYFDDYDADFNYLGVIEEEYNNSKISFSPDVIAFAKLQAEPINKLTIALQAKYVGKQYLDNTENEDRSLEAYLVPDVILSYQISKSKWFQSVQFNLMLNNISNQEYQSNGYTWYYNYDGQRSSENWYYPQAGFNFMSGISIKF